MELHHAWENWLAEPFTRLFYIFFQPQRFIREYEIQSSFFLQRFVPLLRLIIPMFLVSYPLALVGQTVLIPFHLVTPDTYGILLNATVGVIFGIILGIATSIILGIVGSIPGGIILGISFGIIDGIALAIALTITNRSSHVITVVIASSIALSIAGGITGGIVGGFTIAIVVGITGGIVGGFTIAIALAITGGSHSAINRGIVSGIAIGFAVGFAVANEGGFPVGMVDGIAGIIVAGYALGISSGFPIGIAIGFAYLLGYYRLPLYLASGPSACRAYLASRRNPTRVIDYLHRSSLYWDERVYLPLPFLKRTLFIMNHEAPEKILKEIAFILTERHQQLRVAQALALEIAMRDLESRKNLEQIAGASQHLAELLPPETNLSDPRWSTTIARLSNCSRDAMQAISPIGLQTRRQALDSMQSYLQNISSNAFRDQRLNVRLARVVSNWKESAQEEQERLRRGAQDVGSIDNPYKPGQFLTFKDSLFVGRLNLAQELEGSLNSESKNPTFLLNGERRMGKTSALQQLPVLLGSQYISVFYNLQNPGIFDSTATFLDELANGISREMNAHGLVDRKLVFSALREVRRANEVSAYHSFDLWLNRIEGLLERGKFTLLLSFDEFEFLEEVAQRNHLNLPMLLHWLRNIIQFHPRIVLLFSGTKTFSEMGVQTGIDWTHYLINVQLLRVSFLKPKEARQLIIQPTPNYPGERIFPQEIVEMIITETHCHPFLVQAMCSALITQLNRDRREQATRNDVKQSIVRVLEEWESHFHNLWIRSDEEQRSCLIALLKGNRTNSRQLALNTELNETNIHQTLQKLLQRDLVIQRQDGTYELAVPMFRYWMENNV
jgi:uncharacterized protein